MSEKPYTGPFKYDNDGGSIFDANMMHCLDVRGFGALTGRSHGMSSKDAMDTQDAFGDRVVQALNEERRAE